MTGRRAAAGVAALVLFAAAAALAGYGVLLWLAIGTSDSATSSLFVVGLALVVAAAGPALLGWLVLRRGLASTGRPTPQDRASKRG